MKKRLFALFLALCMAVALLPVSVMAEEELIPPSECTCESEGHKWLNGVCQCSACGRICDHSGNTWVRDSCLDDLYCSVCGDNLGALDGHDWSKHDGSCARCPMNCDHCDEIGNTWSKGFCTICGVEHDHWEWTDGVCDSCGYVCPHKEYNGDGTCAVCGKMKEQEPKPEPTPHVHSYTPSVTTPAGCNTPGVCTYTCPCGDSYTDEIPATGKHSYTPSVTTAAGCNTPGVRTYTCSCGDSYTEAIPATGKHSYTPSVTTAATCTTTGVRTYSCSCGDSYTEAIPATGHYTTSYTTKAATCVEAGEYVYTCQYCDYTRTGTIPASGHSYYFSARTEATCGAAGSLTYTCEKCGYSYTIETAPATGEHDYVDYSEAGGFLGKRCTVCGKLVANGELLILENPFKADETKKKKLSQTEVGRADSGENGEIIEIEQSGSDSAITKDITIKSPEEAIDGLLYKITDDQTGEVTESVTIKTGGDDVHELTFGRETDDEGSGASYRVEEDGETIVAREVSVSKKDGVITYEFTSDEGTEVTIEKGESEPLTIGTDENGSAVLQARTLEIDDAVPVESGIVLWVNEDNEVLEYSFGERSEQTEDNEGTTIEEYMEQTGATELVIGRTLSDVVLDSVVIVGSIELENWQPSDAADAEPTPSPEPTPEPEEETEENSTPYVEIVFTTKDLTPEEDEEEQLNIEERPNNEPDTIEERKDNSDITYIVPFVQPEEAKEFGREGADWEELCEVCHKYLPYNDEGICKNCLETRVRCSVCEMRYVYEGEEGYGDAVCHSCKINAAYRCKECNELCVWESDGTAERNSAAWVEKRYCRSCYEKNSSCVPTGTMITLADGTQKPVESVTEDDLLLVYDHEAGTFTTATINFIERNEAALSTVLTLSFSDGSETALVYEHGYFDLDEMRYVFLTAENAEDYIGHRFYKAEIVDGVYTPVEAELVDVTVTEEVIASYDFPTKYHLNFFADGFLSMPAETAGLTNFFAYDENLAYDTESMTAAIGEYGLLEYADLAQWLTPDEFVSYPAQYLSVNYGNGTLTEDALIELIETYVHEYR